MLQVVESRTDATLVDSISHASIGSRASATATPGKAARTALPYLKIARGDGSDPVLMRKLAKTALLVLDDWGLGPLTAAKSRELVEVLEDRCQTKSTVVASQAPVEKWYEVMPDSAVADAVMDRLVHNALKIALRGESMRKIAAAAQQKGE